MDNYQAKKRLHDIQLYESEVSSNTLLCLITASIRDLHDKTIDNLRRKYGDSVLYCNFDRLGIVVIHTHVYWSL